MDKKIINGGRIIEYNEKAIKDTIQLLKFDEEEYKNVLIKEIEHAENDETYENVLAGLSFPKNKTLWVEVNVEDSYVSGLLYNWLFAKSNHDNTSLHALGCSINSIHFEKPGTLTDVEKQAIITLYNKIIK